MASRWRLIGLLWLLQLVNYIDRANLAVAGPSIMQDLHLSPTSFGWVLTAFSIGYTVLQIPGGWLADRYGARIVLIIAPIVWSIFVGATGLAESFAAMVAVRLLFGMAEGSSNAALYKTVGSHFSPHERGLANNLWITAYAFGPALAAPIVALVAGAVGWRSVFYVCVLPGFAVAAILAVALPREKAIAPPTPGDRQALMALLREPAVWLLGISGFLFDIAYWGLLGWLPTYLNKARGLDLQALGWAASVPYLAAALGLVIIGFADRRFFHQRRALMIAAFTVLAAIGLWSAVTAASPAESIASLCGANFCLFGVLGSYGGMFADMSPEKVRGQFTGVMFLCFQAGGIAAPVLIGFAVRQTGTFGTGFGLMIGSLLVSACCLTALHQIIRRPARTIRSAMTQAGVSSISAADKSADAMDS